MHALELRTERIGLVFVEVLLRGHKRHPLSMITYRTDSSSQCLLVPLHYTCWIVALTQKKNDNLFQSQGLPKLASLRNEGPIAEGPDVVGAFPLPLLEPLTATRS